jgi:hypothetical protein
MVLEGAMMTIASLALTVGHPGPVFGSVWQANGFKLWKRKQEVGVGDGKERAGDSSPTSGAILV